MAFQVDFDQRTSTKNAPRGDILLHVLPLTAESWLPIICFAIKAAMVGGNLLSTELRGTCKNKKKCIHGQDRMGREREGITRHLALSSGEKD